MRGTALIVLTILLWAPVSAGAEAVGTLDLPFGNATDVFVLRGTSVEHPSNFPFDLEAYDTVQIRDRAVTVQIKLLCAAPAARTNESCPVVTLNKPHSAYIVPPLASSAEGTSVVQQLLQRIFGSPTEGSTRMGTTSLTRSTGTSAPIDRLAMVKGVGSGTSFDVPITGSLRSLPSLAAPQAFLLATNKGLALAWAGGTPPYSVTSEATKSGQPLGEERSRTPYIWWPNWQMPHEEVTVTVTDSSGHSLQGRLLPGSALPPGQSVDSTTAVISLFQAGDEWRLEALRRLAALAASDTLAAQMLAAIRLSATEE